MPPSRNTILAAPAHSKTRGKTRLEQNGFTGLPGPTRRVYDLVAGIYPLSTLLFHEKAHKVALSLAGIRDGMRVLEVATGSGEMFGRIVGINPRGLTCGFDLSPNMAARTQRLARRNLPRARAHCQAVDACNMPFRDETFDAVVCCYLLELMGAEDILRTLGEIHRVLRPNGRLALVLIGQNVPAFNTVYKVAGGLAPAFWGRQVEAAIPDAISSYDFEVEHDRKVQQGFYPSRVMIARK
jgi:ubiquinone/menaquinone biosynthesis C-methylase UbiE